MSDEDKIYYRKAVVRLIRDNQDKYPTVNEAVLHSHLQGSIAITAMLIADSMDAAFYLNMPIAECARMLEDTCAFAKSKAAEMVLMMQTEGETKH